MTDRTSLQPDTRFCVEHDCDVRSIAKSYRGVTSSFWSGFVFVKSQPTTYSAIAVVSFKYVRIFQLFRQKLEEGSMLVADLGVMYKESVQLEVRK